MKRRRWLRFRIGYLVILAAMGLFTLKFGEEAWAAHQKQLQLSAAEASVHAQERAIAHLKKELRGARAPGFILQEARMWGYVLPGEALVSISFRHPAPIHRVRRAATPRTVTPAWQQWWDAFTGH